MPVYGPAPLRTINNNPAGINRGRGTDYFFSPQVTGNRGNVFQHHHIIPNELMGYDEGLRPDTENGRIRDFFKKLADYGYDQGDPATNGVRLPASIEDALRLGAANHGGSHAAYTNFIKAKILEIADQAADAVRGGASEATAYQQAVREVNGLQAWTRWALQAVDADDNPVLVLRDDDPRIRDGRNAAQINGEAASRYRVHPVLGSNDFGDSVISVTCDFGDSALN